jgi:hypothetical protein
VLGFMAGEKGLHRRIEEESRTGAYVRLHRADVEPDMAPLEVEARAVKRRPGHHVEKVGCEATVRDDATGRALTLLGTEQPEALAKLAATLLASEGPSGVEARRYFFGKSARVEDPRTGTATPRYKDVLRGELDLFIAAWLSRPPEGELALQEVL